MRRPVAQLGNPDSCIPQMQLNQLSNDGFFLSIIIQPFFPVFLPLPY